MYCIDEMSFLYTKKGSADPHGSNDSLPGTV